MKQNNKQPQFRIGRPNSRRWNYYLHWDLGACSRLANLSTNVKVKKIKINKSLANFSSPTTFDLARLASAWLKLARLIGPSFGPFSAPCSPVDKVPWHQKIRIILFYKSETHTCKRRHKCHLFVTFLAFMNTTIGSVNYDRPRPPLSFSE